MVPRRSRLVCFEAMSSLRGEQTQKRENFPASENAIGSQGVSIVGALAVSGRAVWKVHEKRGGPKVAFC